ncbi:MAG: addiction module antidote protein [Janthinobacterium lividum]
MRNLRTFKNMLIEDLKDPTFAKEYLSIALEEYEKDRDSEAFLLALRDVAEAKGGLSKLAERSHLNRQNLYKALSKRGNPKLDTVETILHGLGFRLSIEALSEQPSY